MWLLFSAFIKVTDRLIASLIVIVWDYVWDVNGKGGDCRMENNFKIL